MHTDPDYSAACVVLETDAEDGLQRYGITFTLKKGTEVVVCAVNALAHHVLKKDLRDIVGNFRDFYRQLTSDGQLRWPLWKLLVDMKYCRKVKLVKKREMMDANQRWDVPEAVEWMSNLAEFKPLWIESQPPLMTFWDMLPSPGMCEYVNHLHEHFKYPVIIKNASYMPPQVAGYSTEMKAESVKKHRYPDGEVRKKLLAA